MEYSYFFCEICNRNQVKNKRHIYSKKHRERLNFLLKRQSEKILKLSTFLKNIKIIVDDIEQPEIWCLFCKTTIKSSNSKIACEHIFLHLSYENHIDSINEFWKEQRPDKTKWKKKQFYLDKKNVDEFLKRSKAVFDEYSNNNEKEKQIIKAKKNQEIINNNNNGRIVVNSIDPINSNLSTNNYTNDNVVTDNNNNGIINYIDSNILNINMPYRTVKAVGQNLTCININSNHNNLNNIHNDNSTPLWMMDSSDSESDSEDEKLDIKLNINKKRNDNPAMGPPINLYLDYKEKERKSRLNPNRLGSTLDRDKKISKNWMPNFGGIWNAGPRSSTRKEFLNKLKHDKDKKNT